MQARLIDEAGLHRRAGMGRARRLLLLAFAALAGGVARVALGLRFGLERGQPGGLFFLFAGEMGGGFSRGVGLARLLFGLGGLAGLPGLGRAAACASRSA